MLFFDESHTHFEQGTVKKVIQIFHFSGGSYFSKV